jgi:tetratricopeptide (TPR) repeat protein
LHLLGVIEVQRNNLLAITLLDRAVELDPNNARFTSTAKRAHELKRSEEALACYDHALAIGLLIPRH